MPSGSSARSISQGTSRCNCSTCTKGRFWKVIVPAGRLRLLHHLFCSRCGIEPFGRGHHDAPGEFFAVNVACLDDLPAEELAAAPPVLEDGRHDAWERAPEPPPVL